ncbi:MAG: hypothetical protein QNJ68_10340 [Microcoleaceae cyanobacterium MO_207.B10]|nr:hypothetical protein [Microcoleaceae cyanobacterium MO_207.B10]
MAKKSTGKKSSKSSSKSNSSEAGGKKTNKPLTPAEMKEIIKATAEEEKVKILAELSLGLLNQGNTTNKKTLKKQIEERYGIEVSIEKISKTDIDIPVTDVKLNKLMD